ncbi:hypothetical protein [Pseudescherichia sp.]|uniref:hypothetical protein n=1 Tax=Pseudescherichia sp. TaxID=2055881 RepID=UPI0028A0B063|nr:hypothetical protein [Pseudescherichia sp.]
MPISKSCIKAAIPQVVLAALGLIITLRAFFPGLVSSDALDQYQQATSFIFNDWHPPIMGFIWAITNDWIPGPFGMLLLECFLYWGALLLLSLSIPQAHRKLSIAVLIVGFMPFTVGTLGHIWKDVLHGVTWLCAVGLIAVADARKEGKQKKLLLLAGFLLLIGSMTRFNAVFGLLPLVWLLFNKSKIAVAKKWAVIFFIFPAFTVLSTTAFNYGFLNSAKSHVYQSLIVFDIGGISHFTEKDYFKEDWKSDEKSEFLSTCYHASAWDGYAWGPCGFVLQKLHTSGSWTDGSLMKKWLSAIYEEPGAYLQHRFGNYMRLLWHPNSVLEDQTANNTLGFKYEKTGLFRVLQTTTNLLKHTPFFKPGFWLIASLLFTLYGLYARKSFSRDIFLALNMSSFLYLLAYLVVGVASDFRYAYWSILATSASVPFILLYKKTTK